MEQFDTYQKKVVMRSGLGQSTIAGYLSGRRAPESAAIVHRLVQGVLPDDANDALAEKMLNDGLRAAGFPAKPLPPAAALIREKLAEYGDRDHVTIDLTAEEMDALIDDVEDYAAHQLTRTLRQFQSQSQSQGGGKQLQRQGS